MNYNDRNNTDMNDTLHHLYVISVIDLINIYSLPQDKESSKINDMNTSVDNGHVNGDYCCMNNSTVSESNNQNPIDYKKKRDKISTNR